eukprot:scaffold552_cov526-Prasinococcus_capsulatus_cf.AAC.24
MQAEIGVLGCEGFPSPEVPEGTVADACARREQEHDSCNRACSILLVLVCFRHDRRLAWIVPIPIFILRFLCLDVQQRFLNLVKLIWRVVVLAVDFEISLFQLFFPLVDVVLVQVLLYVTLYEDVQEDVGNLVGDEFSDQVRDVVAPRGAPRACIGWLHIALAGKLGVIPPKEGITERHLIHGGHHHLQDGTHVEGDCPL